MISGNKVVSQEQVMILMEDVQRLYGYDFTHYTKASLSRRINQLCLLDNFASFAELRYRVVYDPAYVQRFVEKMTVNVTEMFRDPSFFTHLRYEILPKLRTSAFIRIWIAGCSTGEEAYSLAILLHEAKLLDKSLIYATDINPSVLEQAKRAIIPMANLKSYVENYQLSGGRADFSSYYTANYNWVKLNSTLQERIVFASHNLVTDASFNAFQLILCRNVLIYFDTELQGKVLSLFDDSLEPLGYLALGSQETLRFSVLAESYSQVGNEKIWRKIK
jgi:chemotaxis protein methyltransferase CheR